MVYNFIHLNVYGVVSVPNEIIIPMHLSVLSTGVTLLKTTHVNQETGSALARYLQRRERLDVGTVTLSLYASDMCRGGFSINSEMSLLKQSNYAKTNISPFAPNFAIN